MRRLQSFASVLLKAVILLFATVKVLHSQQCLESCTYKFDITTTDISIQVTESVVPCNVHNTTFNQTGGRLIINELTPGTEYSLSINCTGVQNCCSNFTTQAVNLTVTHINTTSANVTWTGSLVANASFTFTTRPQGVSNLTASKVTSDSVSLTWVKGQGESPFYRVLWKSKQTSLTRSKSTVDASATITGLTPGTKYEFTVKSVAADNQTEGAESVALPVTTNPGTAENITAVQGNSSMNVSWDKPQGSVERYVVQLGGQSKSTGFLHVEFEDLQAGTVYNCSVTSVLAAVNNTSDFVELATKPNPPDSVSISNRRNSSLSLTWSTPLLMSSATQLSYAVSYSPSGSSAEEVTNGDSFMLSSLASGTLYSIYLTTIGPQNLRSSTVSLDEYTLPNPVTNLRSTSLSTTSVKLEWGSPIGYQSYYRYKVSGVQTNETVSDSSEMTGLQPGTEYNFSVTTTISESPAVQGQPEYVLGYTKPTTVGNLSAEAVSTTQIRLTWDRPPDHKDSYTYEAQINSSIVQSKITSGDNIEFENLVPGTNYTFRVITKANNETSQPVDVSSFTKVGRATGLTAIGTTRNMTVTWDPPTGNVETYVIAIRLNQHLIANVTVTNVTNQEVFQNLWPGKNYTVTVTTKSGPFQEDSDMVSNATYPTPPRELVVEQSTNSSLSLKWERPLNMSLGEYSFIVTIGDTPYPTPNDSITVNDLSSGTQYNVTVKTVGLMDYESTVLTISNYTNPNPLSELKQLELSTSSVTVNWTQSDAKEGYSYLVTVYHPNGTEVNQANVSEPATTATIGNLASGAEYNVTVITQTAGGTRAPAKSIIAFTKPNPITGLVAITQNDSAVFLNWTKPIGFPAGGIYYITTNCSDAQPNRTVQVETIYITGLLPGISCFSTVYSQVNDISGDPVSIEYSTKPPKVFPEVRHVGKNGTLYVTWMPVSGVDKYILSLATAGLPTQTVNISNNESTNHNLSHTFSDLLPATVYTVVVTTVSGSFSESSELVSIATYPTTPGAITIIEKTTGSIALVWESAPNMTSGSFNYTVTYEATGENSSEITTTNTTQLLSGLSSGTPYNISVAAVGPKDLKSDSVSVYLVTTRPERVTRLHVFATSTDSITVRWTPPSDSKDGYKYNVSGTDGTPSRTTPDTEFKFTDLSPGRSYSFSVQSLTADNTGGALVNTSGCTVAAEVSSITCTGPDRTEAILQLTWNNPPGSNTGFEIQLGDQKETIPSCDPTCNHDFNSRLSYHTDYTIEIRTKGCGNSSSVKSVSCKTGITVPPQMTTENTVTTTNTEYNKFTLLLSDSLFNNDTYGPIVAYGILVTSDTGTTNAGGASNYLNNTYSDWTAGKTKTYLAVGQELPSEASEAVSARSRRSTGAVTVEIGDDSQWKGYVNGPLNAKGSYSFAVVIFTKLETQSGLISKTESYFSITEFHSTPVDLPENPAVIGGAIGGGIAAIVIILIVVMIIVATFKRKKNKEDTPGVPIHSIRNKVSEPIKVEDYEAHYRRQRADSFCGFAEEFEDLKPVGINQPKNSAINPENRTKNRYNNVLPYDNSRVKLSVHGSQFDDYINASNMPGYNSRKEFIAAQGPLPVTVNDFWRMIWEKNVHTVVMLTRCNEQGRVKCEEYWPAGTETKHFSNLIVNTTSEIPLEDWTIRDFDVKNVKTAETRAVRHFHFTAWPDHGVPETTELLINFRHLVREHMDQYSRHSPTMVHCSAGVGRTGTFIAIDRLIFQIERDGVVDIYGIIHDLRMHRTLMVQTEDQYVFLNQCAIDIIRSRTGTNVDLIYQNTAALTIYENFEPMKKSKNGYHKA
ncbi:receptor-type tyrosine-protein phosphatase eta [Sardina pilchardus]|uniref:receptor-type tyrosine-protein phosphatase eta n=1 Tax=Sardina pilchardus TaxID=27697 RepID=UPI002E12C2F4